MTQTQQQTYRMTCIWDGWRIDSHTIPASSMNEARRKVREQYSPGAKVTSIQFEGYGA